MHLLLVTTKSNIQSMKTFIFTTILILLCQISFAQAEIVLEGDVNDSSFMAKVEKMRAKGFTVRLNEPDPIEVKFTNNQLPAFELIDLNGQKITSEDLLGKKVHINIWSTSCKPCIEEFPELNELKMSYEKDGYVFIGIAPDSEKKIKKLLAKRPLNYRIIPNAQGYLDELGIDAFPVNFFVDESGVIRQVIHGASYKMETVDGKQKMIPDNYEGYEEALKDLNAI